MVSPNARGWDVEHGDAQSLPGVRNASFDFVHASHVLEHMADPARALCHWWRVLRPGGYLLILVPHRDLYEKRTSLPSRWNRDHKHFFLPDRDEAPVTLGLRALVEKTLPDAEVAKIQVCDEGHTITDPSVHSDGEYSIEMVVRKRNAATWDEAAPPPP